MAMPGTSSVRLPQEPDLLSVNLALQICPVLFILKLAKRRSVTATLPQGAKNGYSIPPAAGQSEPPTAGENEPLKIDSI